MTHPSHPTQPDAEREAFETAMHERHPEWAFTSDPVFDYHNERTRCAWEGWQARAALSREAAAVAPVPSETWDPTMERLLLLLDR